MSARFIPTVERESLDLMDRNVASAYTKRLFSMYCTDMPKSGTKNYLI